MPSRFLSRLSLRWLPLLCMALLIVGLPVGCSVLQHKERELVFRIEPGTASWYSGLPKAVQEFELKPASFKSGQNIHGWWYPADKKDAPAILYLHGVRWNLTGQLFRIEQLHALGYSVLAIDYRGFGQSRGELPSETTVYEDARIAWERFQVLQPDPSKRLIYGSGSCTTRSRLHPVATGSFTLQTCVGSSGRPPTTRASSRSSGSSGARGSRQRLLCTGVP